MHNMRNLSPHHVIEGDHHFRSDLIFAREHVQDSGQLVTPYASAREITKREGGGVEGG